MKEGDLVTAGDLILSLDPAMHRTRLDIAMEQLAAAMAEDARLEAEARRATKPDFTTPPLPFPSPDMAAASDRQKILFDSRRRQREEARRRLVETDAQYAAQIEGFDGQIDAARQSKALLSEDLAIQGELKARGLSRHIEVSQLRRQSADANAQIASLLAERARVEGARREAAVALSQDESRYDEEVAQGLRDTSAKIQELKAEIVSLRGELARTELRAPATGIVHELTVPAPGAVIAGGAVLAQVVPSGRRMQIEVAVEPRNIESIYPGQSAEILLIGFDPRAMPRLPGQVELVSPSAVSDPETGRSFYRVRVALDEKALPPGTELRPGMQVETFFATGERSLLSWLISPLARPLAQAMRER